MIFAMICSLALKLICIFRVASGFQSRNFPLDDCSTDKLDVLFLYFHSSLLELMAQGYLSKVFCEHLSSFPSNKTTPRVLYAAVHDRFSANNPNVNVSSWYFGASQTSPPYGGEDLQIKPQKYQNVSEIIELKIHFIKRLFSEMGGVRQNVFHVAIMFLQHFSSSFDENRHALQIVEQHDTEDIKIFACVIGSIYKTDLPTFESHRHLTQVMIYQHLLIMRMCRQCMVGWSPLDSNIFTDDTSCYMLMDLITKQDNFVASLFCTAYGGMLAAIETRDELTLLQQWLLIEHRNRKHTSLEHVHIGLYGNSDVAPKTFYWTVTDPPRPLVVNNWLPGNPSTEYSNGCTVWQFVWSHHKNGITNFSSNEDRFVEGWKDVDCYTKTRLSLCETNLPTTSQDKTLSNIKSAPNKSFSEALAKGNFVKFRENIVSVSAHITSEYFLEVIGNTEIKSFPLFDCGEDAGEHRYISYLFVCDSLDDCINKRDEAFCKPVKIPASLLIDREEMCWKHCRGVYCCDGSCLQLRHVNDGHVDCKVCEDSVDNETIDEDAIVDVFLKNNENSAFICNRGRCVFSSQLTSSLNDCYANERPSVKTTENARTTNTCKNILGRNIWTPKCIFIKDKYGAVLDCRRMSHLEECADFVCPEGYVKCPNSYCIPQHYVLDGQADCPTGDDEISEDISICTGNFACWDSKVCLHPDLVCDGHPDCPHRDDEVDCQVVCAEGFRCMSGTFTLQNKHFSYSKYVSSNIYTHTRYVDLSGADLSGVRYVSIEVNIAFIILSNCRLNNLTLLIGNDLRLLQYLDVSYNPMHALEYSVTYLHPLHNLRNLNVSYNRNIVAVYNLQLPSLEILDLSHTGLTYLDQSLFLGLPNLKYLDLSFTSISILNKTTFGNLYLNTLDVRGLPIETLNEDLFNGLIVSQHLYTDRFELCCPQILGQYIPYHTCNGPVDAISSCYDMIRVNVQRILLWAMATFAVLGNMTVIVYRVIWDRSVLKTGYGLFVTNLGISDFIMGVYLFIIAGADYYYHGVYVLYDNTWRHSMTCRLAGFLATLSTETSTFFVFLITLDRYLLMKFPFGQIKLSKLAKIMAVIMSWIIGIIISLSPIVFSFGLYSSAAMCIGLPLTSRRLKGWEFSFVVFIVLNLFMCLVVAFSQRAIFRAMSENRISGNESGMTQRRTEDILVAKHLSLIAVSNFLCWFPVGFMGLLSFSGREISNDVYAWTVVIILPINSAANPLLYTIPILLDKWNKFKFGGRRK